MEATVLKRTDGMLGIVGQASDASVGGGVFTDRLVAFCAKDFKRRTGGLDIFESKRSVLKVILICDWRVRFVWRELESRAESTRVNMCFNYWSVGRVDRCYVR